MSGEPISVSSTRLYLGNVPVNATKADIEEHFSKHGHGKINEIKLMNGFAFIEYDDQMDARDVVPAFHGSEFMGNRLIVQFARGNRPREGPFHPERNVPRTRRTQFRMTMSGLPPDTSWQDLKDFARQDGLDVVYSEVSRDRDGKGFVEYETEKDLRTAVETKDNYELKPGFTVHCVADIQPERPRDARERMRSRSPRGGGYGPPPRGGGGGGGGGGAYYDEYYDRRRPPPYEDRGGYRERSPPRRAGYYEPRDRYGRSPPPPRGRAPYDDYPPGPPAPRGGGYEDYPPARRPYGGGGDDGYGPPPPRRGYGRPPPYEQDPYMNGRGGGPGYERPPSPRGRRTPPAVRAASGDPAYERPRY